MGIRAWLARYGGGKEPVAASSGRPISVRHLSALIESFPIGRRVRYHPDYQRETKLDTVILGFELDRVGVFSAHALRREPGIDGTPRVLRLVDGGSWRDLADVSRVRLIVPHQERTELDFDGSGPRSLTELRASLTSDFRRGNAITLFRKTERNGLVQLATEVERVFVIREGYHANLRAVLLEPDLGTLKRVEHRRRRRIATDLPAELGESAHETLRECIIEDFSERFLRIAIRGPEDYSGSLAVLQQVLLKVPSGVTGEPFVLKGIVHRKEPTHLAVALTGIQKNRRFQPLELVDEIEIKTALIQHPATQRVQADRRTAK